MDQDNPEAGPTTVADMADVEQEVGTGSGADADGDVDRNRRAVGVTAAVDRGPAELSDEGQPVRDNPHVSLEETEPARSTDDL
jgi:hypothetical protein